MQTIHLHPSIDVRVVSYMIHTLVARFILHMHAQVKSFVLRTEELAVEYSMVHVECFRMCLHMHHVDAMAVQNANVFALI